MTDLRARVLHTTSELEAFEPEWTALWRRDPRATPFQSAAWLLPWWRHFGGEDLRAVVVADAGAVLALLPFYVHRDPISGDRQLLPLGIACSDYLDGVFAPECGANAVRCGVAALLAENPWDHLVVEQLRDDSPLLRALSASSAGRGGRYHTQGCARMTAVPASELPKKIRRNVANARNRAERRGPLTLVSAAEAEWSSAFELLVRLHAARWSARGEPGVFADARVVAWHREAIPRLAREHLVRLSTLRSNGDPLAASYSLIDPPARRDRTEYLYLMAFSPEFADVSPGTLLLASAVERAHDEGVVTLDLLRGEEPYKQLWKAEELPTWGLSYRRGAPTARPEAPIGEPDRPVPDRDPRPEPRPEPRRDPPNPGDPGPPTLPPMGDDPRTDPKIPREREIPKRQTPPPAL